MCMNSALVQFGFRGGNVLEPSMGIGNFFGSMPAPMQRSKLYGVELDSISGRIAKQLYQNANISITGFENTTYPDNFFDVVVGNVPFGDYKVFDPKYNKYNFRIHDYFLAKALDQVRPGGMVAVITTKGTLDKANPTIRKYLAERAELVGAIRLPNTAFKDNAGTEVTADILFLQKRERKIDIEPDWVHLGVTENGIAVNSYFAEHPEMMLGSMEYDTRIYGQDSRYKELNDIDMNSLPHDSLDYVDLKNVSVGVIMYTNCKLYEMNEIWYQYTYIKMGEIAQRISNICGTKELSARPMKNMNDLYMKNRLMESDSYDPGYFIVIGKSMNDSLKMLMR